MPTPVAVVTGAARGIGAAIATELASQGWSVAVADLDVSAAERTAAGLPLVDGAVGVGIGIDVADTASTRAAIERVETELGAIDALVNNAGIDVIRPFVDSTEEEWDRVIAVNLRGTIGCCRAVIDGMIERGSGAIVNIASDAGRVGSSGEAVYSATKGGVIAFTKTPRS